MKRIENDSFYEFIKKYDPDSQYHFVGEVDYHLLCDDKPYEGMKSHREALNCVFDGHEWYGSCCWSVYDKTLSRYVVMLVSATD